MYRNHGLVRSVNTDPFEYENNDTSAHPFDFHVMGNNFRNTDINAYIGSLDLKNWKRYSAERIELYRYFLSERFMKNLQPKFYHLTENDHMRTALWPSKNSILGNVPFGIPLIFLNSEHKKIIQYECENNGIETRPIISGNLLRQTCYSKYDDAENFPNSDFLHTHGFYVGLHKRIDICDIDKLIDIIDKNIKKLEYMGKM